MKLRHCGLNTAATLVCLAGFASAQTTWTHDPAAAGGPPHWGSLSTPYGTCGATSTGSASVAAVGMAQTPVNIVTANNVLAVLPEIKFEYNSTPFEVENTGHVVEVVYEAGSSMKLGRSVTDVYQLVQFHFHAPSEHTINGKRYDAELHLVHQNILGQLAVVGVLLSKSESAVAGIFDQIAGAAPMMVGNGSGASPTLNASSLLPEAMGYFNYMGSLTTPPCTEGVRWYVMQTPVTVTGYVIDQLHTVAGQFPGYNGYPNNNRPVTPLNGRSVLTSY